MGFVAALGDPWSVLEVRKTRNAQGDWYAQERRRGSEAVVEGRKRWPGVGEWWVEALGANTYPVKD